MRFRFLFRLCFLCFFDVNGLAFDAVVPLACARDGRCLCVRLVAALMRVCARVCVAALVRFVACFFASELFLCFLT